MKNKLSKKLVVGILSIFLLGSFLSVSKADAAIGIACWGGFLAPNGSCVGYGQKAVISTTSDAKTPILSQTSITVGIGQSASVTSTNGVSVYMEANSAPTVATISISGTQVTITGQALGSATIGLCAVGTASDCTNLSITVQAGNAAGVLFSQSNLSLSTNSSQSVTISGGIGTYMVWSNSNTSVASTNLAGSILTVSGLVAGSATITICDTSNTNTCGTLPVMVNSTSASDLSLDTTENVSTTSNSATSLLQLLQSLIQRLQQLEQQLTAQLASQATTTIPSAALTPSVNMGGAAPAITQPSCPLYSSYNTSAHKCQCRGAYFSINGQEECMAIFR